MRQSPDHKRQIVWLLVFVTIDILGCAKQEAAPSERPGVPVVVSKVVRKTVPVEVSAIGNAEAYSTVSIKAQVSGELLEVHFKEGDFVKKGQLLLTIDPRPYEAARAQTEAALARDKAVAANDRSQADRYLKLLDAGVIPAQQAESFTSTAAASDAVVKADEASVQTAELNLEYCKIYSPIDGRTGIVMLKPGNLVKVADVPIVVINQVNPIFVNFTVPQQYLPSIKNYMARGPLSVHATMPNETGTAERGTLTFVDNAVDVTTGTIHLRATFENAQNLLWPGLYVNILLTLSEEPNSIVVPSHAVVTSQQGSYVYVVKPNSTVEQRPVVVDRVADSETVLHRGLSPNEMIVTDGQANLIPGAKIQIKNSDVTATPGERPTP